MPDTTIAAPAAPDFDPEAILAATARDDGLDDVIPFDDV